MEGASTTPNNSRRTYSRRALEGVTADYEDWELGDSIVEDIELYRYVHATIGVSTADIQQIIDAAEITEEHADIDGRPEKGSANALNPLDHKPRPIKFKDAIGRKFSFPFQLCATWAGMEKLITQAFLHVDVIGPHVVEGHYDLIGPNGEIILPRVWETSIEPDWFIKMHMWPVPTEVPGVNYGLPPRWQYL
ncbi:uncharacterized protein K444DRAFT_541806 [Hyaloscypha bicolor E]|uniref:Ubiquitin-like domain-containing protein n=1 Tax=Hyaloscypha bicolor E TaxID=1095630 RepID=A0A2J6SR33_9HELO|nr:uncharacterized protein K444DRAFT_541806 [Hyaloscypha bicolor E]PMD53237.1 hypothetical protein K444DRAFT_541806 [Hyaloscypha bicolor E]